MKRSEKLHGYSREHAGWCGVLVAASVAGLAWSAAWGLDARGLSAVALSVWALVWAGRHGAEAWRYARLSAREMQVESARVPEVRL